MSQWANIPQYGPKNQGGPHQTSFGGMVKGLNKKYGPGQKWGTQFLPKKQHTTFKGTPINTGGHQGLGSGMKGGHTYGDQAVGAGISDYENLLKAQQFNWQNAQNQIGQFQGAMQQGAQTIGDLGGEIGGEMGDMGKMLMDEGHQDYEHVKGRVDKTDDEVKGRLDKSEETFQGAIDQYEDTTAQNLSGQAYSAARDAKQQRDQIMNDPSLDEGTRQAMVGKMDQEFRNQRQSAITPMTNAFNENMMSMKTRFSELQAANAQTMGGTMGQGTGHLVNAGQVKSAMASLGSGLVQSGNQMKMASQQVAQQMLYDGNMAMFEMIKNNPFSPVSMLETFMAMHATTRTLNQGPRMNPFQSKQFGAV